ncbi:hypothetical protein ACWDRR_42645 [Kitasatospora sp. NPDC003701]
MPLSAWTWIDSTPEGLVAFVLITPATEASSGLGALAQAAGLESPDRPLPSPGLRLVLHDSYAMVILPRAKTALRIPTDEGWSDFVRRGGAVVVIMGERSLVHDAERTEVESYLLQSLLPGGLWMAKTSLAAAHPPAGVRGEACIVCGRGDGQLDPVGYAYTPTTGAPLGWAVVAHPTCPTEEEQ